MRYTKPTIVNQYAAASIIQSEKNSNVDEAGTLIPSEGPAYSANE